MAIHLNVRSLSQHFEDLCNLLDSSAFVFYVIGCSETWFTTQTDANFFQIPGYNLISDNHIHSIAGGVALLVKSKKNFCVRDDLKINQIENIWVETQDMIIGVIYKPPSFSNLDFLDRLEETLHGIYLSKKNHLCPEMHTITKLAK